MRHNDDVQKRRRIPPSHRSVTGQIPSRYPSGPLLYESKLERDFLLLLELDGHIRDVITQPMTIDLTVDGQARTYTPDVMAVWQTRSPWPHGFRRVVFEVKPLAILRSQYAALAPKYRAARRYFAERNVGYRVVTERTIRSTRLANAELIAPTLRGGVDQDMVRHVQALVRPKVPHRLGDIRCHLEDDGGIRGVVMEALYYMLGTELLIADLSKPITDDTALTWWANAKIGALLEGT
ncbi:MAG: TnsA endonuclease N-terminal domain-containing protein [Brevundimonas sp.]|nr:TnsA endonuclease N-terminal domain-containing protein [Brevundimonas sp.]